MGRILRNILCMLLFSITLLYSTNSISYADSILKSYYKDEEVNEISDGVIHRRIKQLTNKGIVDINVIEADLSNDNLKFSNTFNRKEFGKRTTVRNLVKDEKDVVASVNGDFFEMYLSPSFELGTTINNGKIEKLSAGEYYNCYSDSLATFLFDEEMVPYITFFKNEVIFKNDKDTLYLAYVNKCGDKIGTIYLSGEYYSSTKDMDNRNPKLYKILVEDDEIIDIVPPGESANITKEQYVICIPESFDRIQNFEIGDDVEFNISVGIDKDIDMSIGGAGIIMKDGELVQLGYTTSGSSARTAIGYNSNKTKLFLVAAGGTTSTNVGLTHYEFAEILSNLGISDAMHLDGGGSTTMVGKSPYNSLLSIYNKLSYERPVMNAFVITNNAKKGKAIGVKITLDSDKVIKGIPVGYNVVGYDANHKEVEIDTDDVIIECNDIEINSDKKQITFNDVGRTNINVTYERFEDNLDVDVYGSIVEVMILPDPIELSEGSSKELTIYALTKERYKVRVDADECDFVISPSSIAKVEDGKIIGLKNGVGTVGVIYDNLEAYSLLKVGEDEKVLENFSSVVMEKVVYPDYVEAELTNDMGKLKIDYSFKEKEESQAAYAKFPTSVEVPKNAKNIKLDVKGDESGNSVKIRMIDEEKNQYTLTICENLDFNNTREFETELPTEYKGKLYIERIYVVTLSQDEDYEGTIYVDNLRCTVPVDSSGVKVPKSVTRPMKSVNEEIVSIDDNSFVFYNNKVQNTLLSKYIENRVIKLLSYHKNINLNLYNENDKYNELSQNNIEVLSLINNGMKTYETDDTIIVSLSSIAGSIYAKDPYQFEQLEKILFRADKKNVIIKVDGDLLSSKLASDKVMLEYVLNKYYKKHRANMFVISYNGDSLSEKLDNGIKYIKIPSNFNNVLNNSILVAKINDDNDLTYNFITVKTIIDELKEITENEDKEHKEEKNEKIKNDKIKNDKLIEDEEESDEIVNVIDESIEEEEDEE